MIEPKTWHEAKCDQCGQEWMCDISLVYTYRDQEELIRHIKSQGWSVDQQGRVQCDVCNGHVTKNGFFGHTYSKPTRP